MTHPGRWLDMTVFAQTDPDTALTGEQAALVRAVAGAPAGDLADATWQRMLDVAWSSVGPHDDTDTADHHDLAGTHHDPDVPPAGPDGGLGIDGPDPADDGDVEWGVPAEHTDQIAHDDVPGHDHGDTDWFSN